MNTKIYLSVLAVLCIIAPQAVANENNQSSAEQFEAISIEDAFSGDMDQGFKYQLAGDAEEEGALKLFFKNTISENDIYDPTADAMSRINPAAGIQLHFDF